MKKNKDKLSREELLRQCREIQATFQPSHSQYKKIQEQIDQLEMSFNKK